MAINNSFRQWLFVVILIIVAILIIDYFVNRNRTKADTQNESIFKHGTNK